MAKYTIEDEARFWSKVIVPDDPEECWGWKASTSKYGYGYIRWCGKPDYGHRASYHISHGNMPKKGLEVCHSCDNPSCCNPRHLFLGTHKQNMHDAIRKGRFVSIIAPRAEESGSAKLTWKEVNQIRELYSTGKYSQTKLAKRFGIHQAHVSRIIRNVTWAYIGPVRTADRVPGER
jgi:hypothetical protein